MDSFDQFDEYFREGLQDHKVKPSAEIWDRMEEHLPVGLPWYKAPYFRGTAIVMISLLGMGVFYFASNYQINASITKIESTDAITDVVATLNQIEVHESPKILALSQSILNSECVTEPIPFVEANEPNVPITPLVEEEVVAIKEVNPIKKSVSKKKSTAPKKEKSSIVKTVAFNTVPEKTNKKKSFFKPFSLNNLQLLPNKSMLIGTPLEVLSLSYKFYGTQTEALAILPTTSNKENNENKPFIGLHEQETKRNEFPIPNTGLGKNSKDKGWYAGTMYQTQGAWLINQRENEEENGIGRDDLEQNTQIGNAYGLVFGYNFGESTGIQVEWILNSEQDYEFTPNADLRIANSSDLYYRHNLNYMLFPVLFKYSKSFQSKLTNNQMSLNHLVGFQYGYLNSAELTRGEETMKSDWLTRSNVGLVVGMDYDVYFTRNAHLSLGARSTFGKSIYDIEGLINNDGLYNVLLGLNASFRYNFNKQKK